MFKKMAVLGLILLGSTLPTASILQARPHYYHARYYPRGYYYRHGVWRPYRGLGHPFRGGYYDRWGRWHRVV
jgi:hypothetical protein